MNEILLAKWMEVLPTDFKPVNSSKLCSTHFRKEDKSRGPLGRIFLRPNAVPFNIFDVVVCPAEHMEVEDDVEVTSSIQSSPAATPAIASIPCDEAAPAPTPLTYVYPTRPQFMFQFAGHLWFKESSWTPSWTLSAFIKDMLNKLRNADYPFRADIVMALSVLHHQQPIPNTQQIHQELLYMLATSSSPCRQFVRSTLQLVHALGHWATTHAAALEMYTEVLTQMVNADNAHKQELFHIMTRCSLRDPHKLLLQETSAWKVDEVANHEKRNLARQWLEKQMSVFRMEIKKIITDCQSIKPLLERVWPVEGASYMDAMNYFCKTTRRQDPQMALEEESVIVPMHVEDFAAGHCDALLSLGCVPLPSISVTPTSISMDHTYAKKLLVDDDTPRKKKLKRKLDATMKERDEAKDKLTLKNKESKMVKQRVVRQARRLASMKNITKLLKEQFKLSESALDRISESTGGINELLMTRQIAKKNGKVLPKTYNPELRSFALTLQFYSPKAYNYIREKFATCLPHPRTLGKWYSKVDVNPGFSESVFETLKDQLYGGGKPLVASLLADEMAIRQQIEFDGHRYHGFVDIGTQLDDDSLDPATEALVFMIVACNNSWKMPVGYFLIAKMNAEERRNLVLRCLEKLHEVGVTIVALTHDGPSVNLALLKSLGVDWSNMNSIKAYFPHPVTKDRVSAFLDPCHMLKLVRNCLADKGSLAAAAANTLQDTVSIAEFSGGPRTPSGTPVRPQGPPPSTSDELIRWQYIPELHNLQEREGLHLGNKLRSAHLNWKRKKMNVRLAAQTFSTSVANSLQFCLNEEGLNEFCGCEPLIRFILYFDKMFDICNSRNFQGKGAKAPLTRENYEDTFKFLRSAKEYILGLKDAVNGKSILSTGRKTGFLGWLIAIESIQNVFIDLVLSEKYSMTFLLTFKFSQDHLELFFAMIRSRLGCNNNPTARQFRSAYKAIIINKDIRQVTTGNCLPLESLPILTVSSSSAKSSLTQMDAPISAVRQLNSSSPRAAMIAEDFMSEDFESSEEDYTFLPSYSILSSMLEKIVVYIAGFVSFRLAKLIKCESCVAALKSDGPDLPIHGLIALKSRGKLCTPADDVVNICVHAEKIFRATVSSQSGELKNIECHKAVMRVMKKYVATSSSMPLFPNLQEEHMTDSTPDNNHVILLLKAVVEKYMQVRFHYAGKKYTEHMKEKIKGASRANMTKLILFTGQ